MLSSLRSSLRAFVLVVPLVLGAAFGLYATEHPSRPQGRAATAGPSAPRASEVAAAAAARRRARARAALLRRIRRHPALLGDRRFLRRAGLVDFEMPVVVRLRGADTDANPNLATIDLGASLGTRSVSLGGQLDGLVRFHDPYEGGVSGNVDVELARSASAIVTTSVPLLWDADVTAPGGRWETAFGAPGAPGCERFSGTSPLPYGTSALPGIPYFASSAAAAAGAPVAGYADAVAGVDDPARLRASAVPGDDEALGMNSTPFPAGGYASSAPDVRDAVLRTAALRMQVADAGTVVQQDDGSTDGPQGADNLMIGNSGGEANLYGAIPGKPWGIDVAVSLQTAINLVVRTVDPDARALISGGSWPASFAACRQLWTGRVTNYLPALRLHGSLHISPSIGPDGTVRLARAVLATTRAAHVALAGCLVPYSFYAAEQGGSDTAAATVPSSGAGPSPLDVTQARGAPDVPCNSGATRLVEDMGLTPLAPSAGTTVDGSRVSLAADVSVRQVAVDVLLGAGGSLPPPGTPGVPAGA